MSYCSVHMPIGWNGLSMPTEGYSVCMPIIITNLRSGLLNRMKVILTHIPIECGVVDLYVYRFLNGSG